MICQVCECKIGGKYMTGDDYLACGLCHNATVSVSYLATFVMQKLIDHFAMSLTHTGAVFMLKKGELVRYVGIYEDSEIEAETFLSTLKELNL